MKTIQERLIFWRLLPFSLIILGIISWERGVADGSISNFYFPPPSFIADYMGELIASGELFSQVGLTLTRMVIGFTLGVVPAALIGLGMGYSPKMRASLDWIVAALHPLPKVSILPLLMIFIGIGEQARIAIIIIAAFFPMLINTMSGVLQIPQINYDVARNLGAKSGLIFRRVVIPASLPMALTGIRLAGSRALTATITAEVLISREGLGSMVWLAWETLQVKVLFSALVMIIILGVSMNALIKYLTQRMIQWKQL